MPVPRRIRTILALVSVGPLVVACASTEDDFVGKAQDVIVERFASDLRIEVTATCATPTSTAVGTTFVCEAHQGDAVVATFLAEITGAHEVVLTQQP